MVRKSVMHQGSGIFSALKKGLSLAIKTGSAVGIKPSDLVSKVSKGKTGIVGTLSNLGANLLKQQGLGGIKKGDKFMIPQSGAGFFSSFAKGFLMPFKLVASAAKGAAGLVKDVTGMSPSDVAALSGHPKAGQVLAMTGNGKKRGRGPQATQPNRSDYGHARGLGPGAQGGGRASYPNAGDYGKVMGL